MSLPIILACLRLAGTLAICGTVLWIAPKVERSVKCVSMSINQLAQHPRTVIQFGRKQ